ncbi:hypothetical protein C8R43DRAFT_494080 [Mycena crocata]|nr:hypothetical protein C8R43DRAFT_494080 [Mycena crocata]
MLFVSIFASVYRFITQPHQLATKKVEIALTRLHTQLVGLAASALGHFSSIVFDSVTDNRRISRRRRLAVYPNVTQEHAPIFGPRNRLEFQVSEVPQILPKSGRPPTCAVLECHPFVSYPFHQHKSVNLPPPSTVNALSPTRCSGIPSSSPHLLSSNPGTWKEQLLIVVTVAALFYVFLYLRGRNTLVTQAHTEPSEVDPLPPAPLDSDPLSTGPEPHFKRILAVPLPAAVRRFPVPSPPRRDRMLGALWPLSSRLAVSTTALGLLGAFHQALKQPLENFDSPRQAGWGVIQEWVELRLSALRPRAVRRSPARLAAALRRLEQQERAELVEVCEGVMHHGFLSDAEAEALIGILTNLGFHGSERLAEGERSLGRNFVERRVRLDATSLPTVPSQRNTSAGERRVGDGEGSGANDGKSPVGGLTEKNDYDFFAT